ncbi:TonB-dependent receptor [Croceibacterium sp. LX-88]|uniref:TonB-dependent receptor n=1 Tax=Croceibacterium selenioxidans TaxID=2838833 RepID=A0ABS5W0H9_9SPHN|nr:TonB-dependent receptor [Croceibacterium selenioxidans]MBT2133278.1 TonB-dependent receptor [Croceibacterium selenioxidans]
MRYDKDNRACLRHALAGGVSAVVLALGAAPALAQGQAAAAPPADDIVEGAEEGGPIYVTGSRIRADGMQAPVPVTVVNASELEALSPGALITAVSQLPQFYGNQTPNSGNFFLRSGYGSLNLRGLGVNRTLTLLNGRRVPSTSAFGGVDINLFPEAMIASVETTTGGASAAYGTDAVAGVVNFILNTEFEGLEVSGQVGVTDRGDGDNYEVSAAWGTSFADDRGHFLVSGEHYNQNGIHNYRERDWYQAWGTVGAGTADNPYRFSPNVISATSSFDGVIFAPGTAINGLAFDRNGNVSPFVLGDTATGQGAIGVPGSRQIAGSGTSGDDLGSEVFTLYPDIERYSAFAFADFDVSDGFTVFGQYLFGQTSIFSYNTPRGSFQGTPTTLTIFQDNAFLPDDLRQTMIDNDIASFVLRRTGSIEDVGQMTLDDTTTQHIGTVGFDWDLETGGLMDGWQVDGFYQYGRSKRDWRQYGLRVDRIFAAADAVRDSNGNIVCRVSTFSGGAAAFPGCVPINLFGRGNASAAAVDYVVGFEPGQSVSTPLFFPDTGYSLGETYDYTTSDSKVNLTTFEQQLAEVSASGNLIDLWAGPVALAFGGSWRQDKIRQVVQDVTNPASDHSSFHPVRCNDPTIGLRGVSGPDCANTVGVQYSKVSNINGKSDVWEAFGEVLIPLLDSNGFTANLNGAGRWADYSGSGTIWAYKGGAEVGLFDEMLRLRGTYSRDVRAANLSERFDKTGGAATVTDPRNLDDNDPTNDTQQYNVTRFSGGNPNVEPERADTITLGAVFQPDFVPGFRASLDWYDIKIKDAISQVGTQSVVNRCLIEGAQEFCDLITFNSSGGLQDAIVGDVFVNVAAARVSGIDLEVSYTTDFKLLGGGMESLDFRGFASWLNERSETNSTGFTTDYAGQTGARQSDGVYFPYPDFKVTAGLTYNNGGFSALLQGRYIGSAIQDVTPNFPPLNPQGQPTAPIVIEDNTVDDILYLDLRLGYQFQGGGLDWELFANVTNLTDADPPLTPSYTAFSAYSVQYNSAVYDVLGRRFTFGVKMKM